MLKEKYIEERFPRFFIFGENKEKRTCDIATQNNPTMLSDTKKEEANQVIAERDNIIDMLITLAQKLDEIAPEEFKKIWY